MCFILAFASNVYATGNATSASVVTQPSEETTPTPDSANSSTPAGPLSGLSEKSKGMRTIKPFNFDTMGDKAVSIGNESYIFLEKGSIPLLVWGVGGSVFMMVLGIIFGKKTVMAGVAGLFISLSVFVLIHYMPEIALSVKSAAGNAIAP